MGLFNFRKKEVDDGEKKDVEKDVMLTLNSRQAPVKRDATSSHQAAPPEPTESQTAPPQPPSSSKERARDTMLDTQSIKKKSKI